MATQFILRDPESNKVWTVRLCLENDKYGLDDCLTHINKDPLVEFYDRKYLNKFSGDRGQFVSRYFLSTLLEDDWIDRGLNLHGGVPNWQVSQPFMEEVMIHLVHELYVTKQKDIIYSENGSDNNSIRLGQIANRLLTVEGLRGDA